MKHIVSVLPLVLAVGGLACATSPAPRRVAVPDNQKLQMETVVVRANPDPLTGLEGYDAKTLLELGAEQYRAGTYDQAVKVYEKLIREFPSSTMVPPAHFNAGLSYEKLEEWPKAAEHFQAIVTDHEGSEPYRDAHFNLARAYGKLEDWNGVADTFWAVRQLDGGLEPMDEIEARVGTGVGLFMQEDFLTAEREFRQALRFYEGHDKKEYLPAKYFVGQARFYLGEIAAKEFEHARLSTPKSSPEEAWVESMGEELEEKCQLLLRAQSHLIRTIRVGHRGWATAAGFRIGSLYEHLFDELMSVPVPAELDADLAEVYKEELRDRVSVLVKKAIRVYEANREMAERVGERNEWVEKTSVALERMKKLYLATAES